MTRFTTIIAATLLLAGAAQAEPCDELGKANNTAMGAVLGIGIANHMEPDKDMCPVLRGAVSALSQSAETIRRLGGQCPGVTKEIADETAETYLKGIALAAKGLQFSLEGESQ